MHGYQGGEGGQSSNLVRFDFRLRWVCQQACGAMYLGVVGLGIRCYVFVRMLSGFGELAAPSQLDVLLQSELEFECVLRRC